MSKLKFEKQFEKQLKDRKIKPSEDSWERLSEKLERKEGKSVSIFWRGIAASVIGGILILSLVFKDKIIEETPEIVKTPSEEVKKEEEKLFPSGHEKIALEEEIKEREDERPQVQKRDSGSFNKAPAFAEIKEEEVLKTEEGEPPFFSEKVHNDSPLVRLEKNIAEISPEVQLEVTDVEIDFLLANAAGEIEREKKLNNLQSGIKPGDLLEEVEMELEESFREKVLEILKEGINKTRTAVVNRNF